MPSPEIESSRRRRRSALRLFEELHQSENVPENSSNGLLNLPSEGFSDKQEKVIVHLMKLWDSSDWTIRVEAEDLINQHYRNCSFSTKKRLQ